MGNKIIILAILSVFIIGCSQSKDLIKDYDWIWTNPSMTSNDLHAVNVFDTSKIVAFGEAGTVLKSSDFGKTWEIDYNTGIYKTIYDSFFFDTNYGLICGEDGIIYKTENGTNSWTRIDTGITYTLYSMDFNTTGKGMIVGAKGNYLLSNDRGKSWEKKTIRQYDSDIISVSVLGQKIVAALSNGKVLTSDNFGMEWEEVFNNKHGLNSVHLVNENKIVAVGNFSKKGNYFWSDNFGKTWSSKKIARKRDLHTIKFVNDRKGLIGGDIGIIPLTRNGGNKWKDKFCGSVYHIYDIDFLDEQYACLVGQKANLIATKWGGKRYRFHIDFSHDTRKNLYDVITIDREKAIAVGLNQALIHTSNYGELWHKRSAKGSYEFRGVDRIDAKYVWAVGNLGTVRFSNDSGYSFRGQNTGVYDTLFSVDFVDKNNGWICGKSSVVLKTENQGNNWEKVTVPSNKNLFSVKIKGSNVFIAGEDGILLRSSDNGNNWIHIDPNTDYTLNRIFIRGKDIWIVGNNGTLLYSNDNLSSLKKIETGYDNNFNSVFFLNDSEGWVVGENGLLIQTLDKGKNWKQIKLLTYRDLTGIYMYNSDRGFICGMHGTILKYELKE